VSSLTSYLKPALHAFEPYTPGQQPPDGEGWIKLNTNESPWPPSPRALEAIRVAVGPDLRLYPSPTSEAAREAIAHLHGVGPDQVVVGNGADELLELSFRAFVGKGQQVAFCFPSYPLLIPLCRIHEAEAATHPLGAGWELPPAFADDPAPLKFLVNPNSPTGSWVSRDHVEQVVARSRGVVVLDEAYVDFAPEDRLDLLADHPNLLIMRSLSKSYALAGMRIGYALGQPELIEALSLVKDSYAVDRLAHAAAVAAIEDRAYHDRLVDFVVEERAWLAGELRRMGFEVSPSAANFVFTRPRSNDAGTLAQKLRGRKILVRHYDREPIAGWLRISIGTREQHELLLQAVQEVTG
jgi:histidinol-phosphate aminotransferase